MDDMNQLKPFNIKLPKYMRIALREEAEDRGTTSKDVAINAFLENDRLARRCKAVKKRLREEAESQVPTRTMRSAT